MKEEKLSLKQRFARFLLKAAGWKLVDERPPESKYLIIGAFHTTNWDLLTALVLLMALGVKPRWIGKEELFRGPLGPIMRRLGGIPVKRGARLNFVGQTAERFKQEDDFTVVIAPEGTRKATDHWKSGFYYIASQAGVPIAFGFADYTAKVCGLGGYIYPSGNVEADMAEIRAFYEARARGLHPRNHSTVRLKAKTPTTKDERQG